MYVCDTHDDNTTTLFITILTGTLLTTTLLPLLIVTLLKTLFMTLLTVTLFTILLQMASLTFCGLSGSSADIFVTDEPTVWFSGRVSSMRAGTKRTA